MSFVKYSTALATAALLSICTNAQAKPITILYVPLDNRPVNTTYVQNTLEAAGCKIFMPPEKLIASNEASGKPDELINWLLHKAHKADAAVISTDSLIYGGLVASRTHQLPLATLKNRVEKLNQLKEALPINLYTFSTIMRTPRASKGHVEPGYYTSYGPQIFAYSELTDLSNQHTLTEEEQKKKDFLARSIPQNHLQDWLQRRDKNFKINTKLLIMSSRDKFHFFAIGKDDNAVHSHTHLESTELSRLAFDFPKDRFQIIDGVDQLGLLLASRAYNELNKLQPKIYPLYSEGVGQATLPQYSDSRFQDSVPHQIIASGGKIAKSSSDADFILAINSPEDGIVQDATAKSNQPYASMANRRFINRLKNLTAFGYKVSLADVSYSNGADNGFMHFFADSGSLEKIIAYNGWNTADNAIGYAIAQGTFARAMPKAKQQKLIRQRLIDDWFYQSNVRNKLTERFEKITREDLKYRLGALNGQTADDAARHCQSLVKAYSFTKNTNFKLTFPWDRLFEVEITIPK